MLYPSIPFSIRIEFSSLPQRGTATSIGEQPIKGVLDAKRGARMAVGEALTNLVFAKISDLKVSANDFPHEKKIFHLVIFTFRCDIIPLLPGEGAMLFDTCVAYVTIILLSIIVIKSIWDN